MESNTDPKLSELQLIVKEGIIIGGDMKNTNDLFIKLRTDSDTEWVNRETICYILREDVFELMDIELLSQLVSAFEFIKVNTNFSINIIQDGLKLLIQSMKNQLLNSNENQNWDKHTKLCEVIEIVLYRVKLSWSQQTCDRMFDYLMKLFSACSNEETIDRATDALIQLPMERNTVVNQMYIFQFNKYEKSLDKLIDFRLENQKQKSLDDPLHYDRLWNLCHVLSCAVANCPTTLSVRMCDRIFQFYLSMIAQYSEDEDMFGHVIGNMFSYPFERYQASLMAVIDLVEFEMEQFKWNRHAHLCRMMGWVMNKRVGTRSTFNPKTCQRILHFIIKLIETCDEPETVDYAWEVLESFPFQKYQSLLIELIDSVEILNRENEKIFVIMEKVLNGIGKDLAKRSKDNSFTQQTFDRMFHFLTQLIDQNEHHNAIGRAWIVLLRFPQSQLNVSLNQVYKSLINDLNNSTSHDWKLHQKWCRIIEKLSKLLDPDFDKPLIDYFIQLFDTCDDDQTILFIILVIEKLCSMRSRRFGNDQAIGLLKDKMVECFCKYRDPNDLDYVRHEVEWTGRWCVANVMVNQDQSLTDLPPIKLSHDRTEARNDHASAVPVRSSFTVDCGIHFYEVTLVNVGCPTQIGWTTRQTELLSPDPNRLSICFDTKQKCLLVDGKQPEMGIHPNLPEKFNRGDVIGCWIDFNREQFVFLYNGQPIEQPVSMKLSGSSYYACALLSLHQQCQFNFGQTGRPFKFAPKDYFYQVNSIDFGDSITGKWILAETHYHLGYWFKFKHSNGVELLSDQTQEDCDELVRSVDVDIANDHEIGEWRFGGNEFDVGKPGKRWRGVRYIQSIVEWMGQVTPEEKWHVMAQWIGQVLEEVIDSANQGKILELINSYIQLDLNEEEEFEDTKHRNICIVLSHLIMFSRRFYRNFMNKLRTEILDYLTQILKHEADHDDEYRWTQLFAFISLANLDLSQKEVAVTFQENGQIMQLLHKWKMNRNENRDILTDLVEFSFFPTRYQFHFLSEQILSHVIKSNYVCETNLNGLNANDQTEQLKLSADGFSASSDWRWQSVRSVAQVKEGSCYFEAILLTNGPARIGWGTKRNELDKTQVGGDEFSIGFDGYNRAVWHKNTKLEPETKCFHKWRAGNVIGCLIEDIKNVKSNEKEKKFSFYLNGQAIDYKTTESSIYSSTQPYYACVSLSAHQQVYLNFGQTHKFAYPPTQKDYSYFCLYPPEISQEAPISLSNLTNTVISIKSHTKMGNVSMVNELNQLVPSNTSNVSIIENTLTKNGGALTTECIICPVCFKKIYLKHFISQCCPCLRLSIETSTGVEQRLQQLAIASKNEQSTQTLNFHEPEAENSKDKLQITPANTVLRLIGKLVEEFVVK